VKADENSKALALLREVLDELDSVEDPLERFTQAVKGVFAGNVFDLGAPKMVEMAASGMSSGDMFKNARATLAPRPWAVDKLDDLRARFGPNGGAAHKKAIVFADNAGVMPSLEWCAWCRAVACVPKSTQSFDPISACTMR
jgi:damage-control phosphatase, subfamily II, stand-alone protein